MSSQFPLTIQKVLTQDFTKTQDQPSGLSYPPAPF